MLLLVLESTAFLNMSPDQARTSNGPVYSVKSAASLSVTVLAGPNNSVCGI